MQGSPGPGGIEAFGRVPNWPIHLGIYQRLPSACVRVYIALCLSASGGGQESQGVHPWESLVTVEALEDWSGIDGRRVREATRELESQGLITKHPFTRPSGLRGVKYRIISTPPLHLFGSGSLRPSR